MVEVEREFKMAEIRIFSKLLHSAFMRLVKGHLKALNYLRSDES